MAKMFASWVPGYTAVAQLMGAPTLATVNGQPFSDVNGYREGFGVHFRLAENQSNWFHIGLPTPVIVEDRRATLGRVMVLFSITEGFCALDSVHVWDGPNRILVRDGLNIQGNHAQGLDGSNTWDVRHDGIAWGIGISLAFSCTATSEVYIASAGGDFFHNI